MTGLPAAVLKETADLAVNEVAWREFRTFFLF
jgi:hypothetical protein